MENINQKKFNLFVSYQGDEEWEITVFIAGFDRKDEAEKLVASMDFQIMVEDRCFLKRVGKQFYPILDADISEAAKVKDPTRITLSYPDDYEIYPNYTVDDVLDNSGFLKGFGSLAYQVLESRQADIENE